MPALTIRPSHTYRCTSSDHRELLKEVKEAKKNKNINVLFTYLWNDLINESFFDEVRNLNIISVNFFCNASYQFHLVDKIAPKVDFCLVPEPVRLINYKNIGRNSKVCSRIVFKSLPKFSSKALSPHQRSLVEFLGFQIQQDQDSIGLVGLTDKDDLTDSDYTVAEAS